MQIFNAIKSHLNFKAPLIAGLHIGASSLKLLCLKKADEQFYVEHYATVPLPAGAVVEKEIKNSRAITDAVKQLVAHTKGKIQQVAIALPDNAVISKIIQMESSLSETQLENLIPFEAEQHLPHPLEEVSLDFQVLGTNNKNQHLVDILLVASHKDKVASRIAAIAAGGMQVKVVDVESYAIERACQLLRWEWPEQGNQQTVAVCMFTALGLSLIILQNNNIIFMRSENFGSEQLTKLIQQRYNLSFQEAEQAKINNNLPENYINEVLEPFREGVISQIRRALQFFFSTAQQAEINYFILAGGSAYLAGLAEKIAEQLKIKVAIANPFFNMTIAPTIDATLLKQEAAGLLLCSGLAMRNFG